MIWRSPIILNQSVKPQVKADWLMILEHRQSPVFAGKASASTRVWAFILCAMVVLGCWLSSPPYFHVNDDAKMQFIMSGGLTGECSPHAVFINYVISAPLTWLYSLDARVPWFLFYQLACLVYALAIFITCALSHLAENGMWMDAKTRVLAVTVAAIFALALFSYAISSVTYTFTASLLVSTALFLHLVRARTASLRASGRYALHEVVLCVLAFCTRASAAKAALPFAVLALLWSLQGEIKPNRSSDNHVSLANRLSSQLVPIVMVVLVIAACATIDAKAYSSTEWKDFKELNHVRSRYMDLLHENYDAHPESYEQVGWSAELSTLVRAQWFFLDERVTKEAFTTLSERNGGTDKAPISTMGVLIDALLKGEYAFKINMLYALIVFVAMLFAACILRAKSLYDVGAAIAAALVLAGEFYYLAARDRIIFRTGFAAVVPATMLLIGLLIFADQSGRPSLRGVERISGWIRAVQLVVCGGLAVVGLATGFLLEGAEPVRRGLFLSLALPCLIAVFAAEDSPLRSAVTALLPVVIAAACAFYGVADAAMVHANQVEHDVHAKASFEYMADHPDRLFIYALSVHSTNDPWLTSLPKNSFPWGGWEFYLPIVQNRREELGFTGSGTSRAFLDPQRVCVSTEWYAEKLRVVLEQAIGEPLVAECKAELDGIYVYRYREAAS